MSHAHIGPAGQSARVESDNNTRRRFLTFGAGAALAAVVSPAIAQGTPAIDKYADPGNPMLPPSTMKLDLARTALVVTDPQIDFLSPKGVTWGVVGASVQQHDTVENIGRLFAAAKASGISIAVSPHYCYPTDKGWQFEGALEKLMHQIGMFNRRSPYSMDGFEESGGPEQNDLALQLRKHGIDQAALAGMSANLCVESHSRELLEQGFEVAVVRDATAAAVIPDGDGYLAALTNFRFIANAVWTTAETVERLKATSWSQRPRVTCVAHIGATQDAGSGDVLSVALQIRDQFQRGADLPPLPSRAHRALTA